MTWRLTKRTPYEFCEGCKRDVGPEEVYELHKDMGGERYLWRYLCEACCEGFLTDFATEKERVARNAELKREQGKALQRRRKAAAQPAGAPR